MTFRVVYADVVDVDVKRMHWRVATRACQAIEAFAAEGTGSVMRRKDGAYELRVPGAVVLFEERNAQELHVLRILPL